MHPTVGAELVGRIVSLRAIRPIVLSHHEYYDGSGYPEGLKGEQIPLGARIIAVADAFEAMTSMRPYRGAMTATEAIGELRTAAGTQFDPKIVERFVDVIERKDKERAAARPEGVAATAAT